MLRIEITNVNPEDQTIDVDFQDKVGTLVNFGFKSNDLKKLRKLVKDLEREFLEMQKIKEEPLP